mmetsp:Transcript_3251/g.8650  ORF Transcript_3251/g.8650 Transcript_3251/m.8650 type:complete len:104 (+) Transcript_3251:355-666(+)
MVCLQAGSFCSQHVPASFACVQGSYTAQGSSPPSSDHDSFDSLPCPKHTEAALLTHKSLHHDFVAHAKLMPHLPHTHVHADTQNLHHKPQQQVPQSLQALEGF